MGPFYFMKISDLSIISIVPFVLGVDNTPSYKGGPKIVELFNAVGFRDDYWILNKKGLFGSRKDFVKNKLLEINGKSQLKEFIEMLVDDRQNHEPDKTATLLNNILKHDKYELVKNLEGIYKISGADFPENILLTPVFEDIEKQVIDHIQSAKYSVWVAVAWITSRPIAEALFRQHQKGINIRVVVNDDELTRKNGIKIENTEIEYYKISPKNGNYANLMHHKFCIIDLKKVITGSFNWTVKASFNNENIAVIEQRDQAEKYADEFLKLIKNLPRK